MRYKMICKDFFLPWEPVMMEKIQSMMNDYLTAVFSFLSSFGEEFIIIAVLVFFYWCIDKRTGRFIALNAIMGLISNTIIKNIFLRRRPYMVHDNVKCLKPVDKSADCMDLKAQGYSFPSAHSTNSVTVFSSLAYTLKKNWAAIAAAIIALLVGFSRIALGNHYPTDVIVGWIIGVICVFFLGRIYDHCEKKWVLYLALAVVSSVGLFICKTDDYFTTYGILVGFFIGDLVQEKYVKFEETRDPLKIIIRLIVGLGLFYLLNVLFKLPFSSVFLNSGTFLSFFVRTVRYAFLFFIMSAIYPLSFRLERYIFREK